MIAGHQIINWIWYLEYEMEGDSVRILKHYRLHCQRDTHPECKSEFRLEEVGDMRTVIAAVIDGKRFPVVNPHNIFSYNS